MKDRGSPQMETCAFSVSLSHPTNHMSLNSVALPFTTGFPGGTVVQNLPANAGDTRHMGSIPGSERSPGVGNGEPLQYSCLENPMNRGTWQATAHAGAALDTVKDCTHTPANTELGKGRAMRLEAVLTSFFKL